MKQTRVYISGKISGLAETEYLINFYNAIGVIIKLKLCKYSEIINPLEIKPLFGIKSYLCHMAADIYHELKCTHVAFQKNWIDSKGARIEMIVAILFNKKIIML